MNAPRKLPTRLFAARLFAVAAGVAAMLAFAPDADAKDKHGRGRGHAYGHDRGDGRGYDRGYDRGYERPYRRDYSDRGYDRGYAPRPYAPAYPPPGVSLFVPFR